jgi:PAS domain-containing protein
MKMLLATRRKPAARGGWNRTLVTIPKGTRAKTHARFGESASCVENSPTDAHSRLTRLQQAPGLPLVSRCERAEENRQRMDENRQRMDENRKMRAYLAPLFAALPCGVLIADSANRFRMANAEACRMLFGKAHGGVAGAAELAGFETELAQVLKNFVDSEARFFQLGGAKRRSLVKVARIFLTAEQGLAADRVYLLQAAAGFRREEPKNQTGATS